MKVWLGLVQELHLLRLQFLQYTTLRKTLLSTIQNEATGFGMYPLRFSQIPFSSYAQLSLWYFSLSHDFKWLPLSSSRPSTASVQV